MPVVKRPVSHRRARLATTITTTVVLILLGVYACSAADVAPAGRVRLGPPLGVSAYGNLASQVALVKTRRLWAGAYAISTYPTTAQLALYGGTGTLLARLGRVGAAQARFNIATMVRVGLRSPMVWMDIEPRTQSPWSASPVNNNAVIDGVIGGYRAAGVRAGIYSYTTAWKAITGGRLRPGLASWVSVGHKSQTVAAASCSVASYSGSPPWLIQWTGTDRDYDLTCPPATGWAAVSTP